MAAKLRGSAETGLGTSAVFLRTRKADGFWWSTSGTPGYEVYDTGSIADYAIASTEQGVTGEYTADDPSPTVEGDYQLIKKAGASLAQADLIAGKRWTDKAGLRGEEVAAIKAKTDFLPSATAGTAGGLFIAGANAATTVNLTGNLSGSVGSVTGAVGSVTGVTFPTNFSALLINASGHISRVTLVDTLTTYTLNIPQTGDSFARLGAPAGASIAADIAAGGGTVDLDEIKRMLASLRRN